MIKEHAATATGLTLAVRVGEVFVAPLFESRVEPRVVRITDRLERTMKMRGILTMRIHRGEVRAPAKPGIGHRAVRIAQFEVADVHVHGGNHRTTRVDDETDARRVEVRLPVLNARATESCCRRGGEHAKDL